MSICMGNPIANSKRYLHAKVLNKKAALYCSGDFLAFCTFIYLIERDLNDFLAGCHSYINKVTSRR